MRRKHNLIPKLHVKKGDTVIVLSGNDKGQQGRVLEVFPEKRRALVESVNIIVKHQKPTPDKPEGARVEREAPVPVSKLMVVDPKTGKPTRVGRIKTDKSWVRVSKKSGEVLDK
jgi:large subunit ribosomal protein L24